MSDSINHGAVGTDGAIPVYDPQARWCWWGKHEIYQGGVGLNRYVPKVRDYVVDVDTFTVERVVSLDPVTLIPVLQEIKPNGMSFTLSDSDVLFGVGPGPVATRMRAYLNTTNIPASLTIDQMLRIGGSMSSYAKIFKGADIGETGEVISKVFDSAGNFVSENVPLELVEQDNHTNYSWKVVRPFHITTPLQNGELVTVVFYGDNDHVVSKSALLVENTTWVRSLNVSRKYITHISVEGPFVTQGDGYQIDFPLNIPANALNLTGVVHYSDGSVAKYPVNGNKFTMLGIDQLLSSVVNQSLDLVLRYALDSNETSFANNSVQSKYVTQPYRLKVVNPNNSYTVKLFVYPTWDIALQGYRLKFWLLNLDRNLSIDVTSLIHFDDQTPAFDPQGYGFVQRLQVSLNLRDVSSAFKAFVHTQLVEVTLYGNPDNFLTPWTVRHEGNTNQNRYGQGLVARRLGDHTFNLTSSVVLEDDWIQKFYRDTYPLVNPSIELDAPLFTHFRVTIAGVTQDYRREDWNQTLAHAGLVSHLGFAAIRFIKRTSSGDVELAQAAVMIKNPPI